MRTNTMGVAVCAPAFTAAASHAKLDSKVDLPQPVGPSNMVGKKPSTRRFCETGSGWFASGGLVTGVMGAWDARNVASMRRRI
jgi:hypothetical protein